MPSRRTTSWKTSSQRRSRPGIGGGSGIMMTSSSSRGGPHIQHSLLSSPEQGSVLRTATATSAATTSANSNNNNNNNNNSNSALGTRNRGMRASTNSCGSHNNTPNGGLTSSLSSTMSNGYGILEEERGMGGIGIGGIGGGAHTHTGSGVNRGIIFEHDDDNDDDDDDDFGLDDILSGLTGNNSGTTKVDEGTTKTNNDKPVSSSQDEPPSPLKREIIPNGVPTTILGGDDVVHQRETTTTTTTATTTTDANNNLGSDDDLHDIGLDMDEDHDADASSNHENVMSTSSNGNVTNNLFGNNILANNSAQGSNSNSNNNIKNSIKTPPDAPSSPRQVEEEEVSLNDNENHTHSEMSFTLSSDGDATRQHKKMMEQSGESPMFSSGFIEAAAPSSSSRTRMRMKMSPQVVEASYLDTKDVIKNIANNNNRNKEGGDDDASDSVNSFLDEVEVDLLGYEDEEQSQFMEEDDDHDDAPPDEETQQPPQKQQHHPHQQSSTQQQQQQQQQNLNSQSKSKTSSPHPKQHNNNKASSRPPTHPSTAPASGNTTNAYSNPNRDHNYIDPPATSIMHNRHNNNPADNDNQHQNHHHHRVFNEVHRLISHEEETLSTVTDPTESPFIYTYKKPKNSNNQDDDSVSQITSSIFGGSYASSYLQNIPSNIGAEGGGRGGRSSSRNNRPSNTISWMGGTSVVTGSRMNHRKRSSNHGSSNGSAGGSNPRILELDTNDDASHNMNGAGVGVLGGGLDEIQFVLNAEAAPTRNQRARRPPQSRGSGVSLADISSVCSADDASTLDSRQMNTFTRNRRVVSTYPMEYSDNVSKLGLGGVSCAGQSSSANSLISESTKSKGLLGNLLLFARKTQHKASRFFLPHSPEVERRKKYDRSDSCDSLEEMLLEEGMVPRSNHSSMSRRHHDDEDIDYFSRAMSTTASHSVETYPSRKPKNGKDRSGKSSSSISISITQLVGTFLFVTVALTVYRGNVSEQEEPVEFNFAKQNPPGVHPYEEQNYYRGMEVVDTGEEEEEEDRERNDNGLDPLKERNKIINSQMQKDKEEILKLLRPEQMEQDSLDSMATLRPKPVEPVVQIPSSFDTLVNVDEPPFQRGIDIPFYWHVPRSGGGTVNDILGSCLRLTLAADAGASDGNGQEDSLKVVTFARSVSYVNVDTSSHQGIERAKRLNLASSGLADAVISPLLHEASSLFTPTQRGRMFTIIRHPVERAASLFYFIQDTQWKQPSTRNDQFADISIEDFYKGGFAENNWMTRFLTNELTKGELTDYDLNVAKEVLKRKCLVGLLEAKTETFERIEKYFGWKPKNTSEQECLEKKLEWAWPMKHRHFNIEEGTDAWFLISAQNKFDIQLYQYAKQLFLEQADLFENK